MPVGFGYIRDEQPAIVDWSAITREARDTIKSIEADRQKKREGVDQAIRDQSEALLNRPKSQNPEYNSAMSNMTAQIESTMLQNYNDLRLGNINLNQFNATKNTMMSETKGVLAIAKVYADQYDANVEGAQNGTLSGFSNWTNAMTQEMMDFQGVETFVGPNGKISFVKKKEDGTTETLDTSELFTLANMKQQKFDMEAAIEKAKEKGGFTYGNNLGEETKGYFIDPLTGKKNTNAISKAAASMVAQDSNAYGILYDYIGGYDFKRLSDDFFAENQTGEEQKAALGQLQKENENVIYIDSNGMPIVSESQRNVAQQYVKEQLEQVAVTSKQEELTITDKTDDNIKRILDLTLIAQRSGQRIDKDTLGILLANTKGNINFEALSSALEDIPNKPSAAELKKIYDEEKALKNAMKIDFAENYLRDNLFTVDGAFVTPEEGDEYAEVEIETLITPLGLNMQKDDTGNLIVYDGNRPVISLGKKVTQERMKLLKEALVAGDEDMIYALYRRSNPDYTYESDVEVEEEFILD